MNASKFELIISHAMDKNTLTQVNRIPKFVSENFVFDFIPKDIEFENEEKCILFK